MISLASSRATSWTVPLEEPLVDGASGTTTGPGSVAGVLWMWAAVAGGPRKLGCLVGVRAFVCGIIPMERALPLDSKPVGKEDVMSLETVTSSADASIAY